MVENVKSIVTVKEPIEVHPFTAGLKVRVRVTVFVGEVILHQTGGLGVETEEYGEVHIPYHNLVGVQKYEYRPLERTK